MYRASVVKCLALFIFSQIGIVLIHLLTDGQVPVLDISISRYVGSVWWSAILFALSNFMIVYYELKYFRELHAVHPLPKICWFFLCLLIMGLIGLSVCPSGLFPGGQDGPGVITYFHGQFAKLMFLSMIALVVSLIVFFYWKIKVLAVLGAIFIVYGLFFVFAYALELDFLHSNFFIFENLYLLGFFAAIFGLPRGEIRDGESDL